MLEIGGTFDEKYQIIHQIGSGGFGEVYLAQDILLDNRYVAIKSLKEQDNNSHVELINEMQFLENLNHPNIVRFYHHFRKDGLLYLVMEYCKGGSLRDMVKTKVSENEILKWISILIETLEFVHDKGVIHHDIKPDNLLLSANGILKIGDFGVANRMIGTRAYLPPEWFMQSNLLRDDVRIDIYALGITLLELLTGRNPLFGLDKPEIVNVRLKQSFVPDNLKNWIQEIILKATHPTPELRFQNMTDFKEAIQSKYVPVVINSNKIEAARLSKKGHYFYQRKQYSKGKKCVELALSICPDDVAALVMAGRYALLRNDIASSERYFDRVLTLNPRVNIQKELARILIEKRKYSKAISLLNDHLYRNGDDFEAYNLMLKVYYLTDRHESGIELADSVLRILKKNRCFENNRLLCSALLDEKQDFRSYQNNHNPFIKYNSTVLSMEKNVLAKNDKTYIKDKLLFQDYQYGDPKIRKHTNIVHVYQNGEKIDIFNYKPLISIGRYEYNDIVINHGSVSRLHAVLLNLQDDVWIYDLNSTLGIYCDDDRVNFKRGLKYIHNLKLGTVSIKIHLPEFLGQENVLNITVL